MNKNTIAITANTSWYLYNFRSSTISALLKAGYDVVAIAPLDAYSHRLLEMGCRHSDISIDSGGTNPFKDLMLFFNFWRVLRRVKPKVILNFTPKNNIYATLAAAFTSTVAINNIAGLGFLFGGKNLSSKIATLLYRVSQPFAYYVFFQNKDDLSLFLNCRIVCGNKSEVLPGSGVDLSRFLPSPRIDDGIVNFVLLSRMLYEKGIGYYVEAARLLTNKYGERVSFVLVGFLDSKNPTAVSRRQMEAWVEEGVIKYFEATDKVENHIAESDCVVLPSYYREGVPKCLLEAAASAKPIITTDNVGCREVVDHGANGFLCKMHSVPSLVASMEQFIALPYAEKIEMGNSSRVKAEKYFDENIIIERYLQCIRECLE